MIEEKIKQYLNILTHWNETMNLVSSKDKNFILERHISEGIKLSEYVNDEDILLDIGSGNGIPGIILAICKTNNISLLDSNIKKASFLREVSSKLSLKNCNVICDRLEKININQYNCFVSRATYSVEYLLKMINNLKQVKKYRCLFIISMKQLLEVEKTKIPYKAFELNEFSVILEVVYGS